MTDIITALASNLVFTIIAVVAMIIMFAMLLGLLLGLIEALKDKIKNKAITQHTALVKTKVDGAVPLVKVLEAEKNILDSRAEVLKLYTQDSKVRLDHGLQPIDNDLDWMFKSYSPDDDKPPKEENK